MTERLKCLLKKNEGMTLVEVITALVLFTFVFMILLYGINMALKVMGNASAVNEATQKNASALESLPEQLEKSGLPTPSVISHNLEVTKKNFGEITVTQAIPGSFMEAKLDDNSNKSALSLILFDADKPAASVPLPSAPQPTPALTVIDPNAKTEWDPYVPKPVDTTLNAKFDTDFMQSDGGITQNDKDYDRGVVRTPQLFTGSQNGAKKVTQLFFNGTPAIIFSSKDASVGTYQSNLFYFNGNIEGNTKGQQTNMLLIKKSESHNGILIYFNQAAQIKMTHYNDSDEVTSTDLINVKKGYYFINQSNAYNLLTAATSDDEKAKFATNYTGNNTSGYYLDPTDSTCKAKLLGELKARNIQLIDVTDDSKWIDPNTKQ